MAGPDSAARTFKDLGPALEDVQGEIFRGYDHAMGVHLLLHVNDAAGARAWLRDLVPMVTTAADFEKHSDTSLNVAFTADGLAAIGLPQTQLSTFPPEFREGMAARAPILGGRTRRRVVAAVSLAFADAARAPADDRLVE